MLPFRKILILALVGLYLSGFLMNAAAAMLQDDSCGRVCCCMQMKPPGLMPSIQSTPNGCCSANTARPCDLQSGTTVDITDLAIHNTQISGDRLLSYPGDASHLIITQQMPMKPGWLDRTLSIRNPVPLYLETRSLLC